MKTYLELKVPLSYDARWYEDLRNHMSESQVSWQKGYFHITMAFCDETPDVKLCPVLAKHLSKAVAPIICFDKLDVFKTPSNMFIIHLGTSNIPNEFASLIENMRNDLKSMGCVMKSNFNLHVTLGRLRDSNVEITEIKDKLCSFSIPSFSLKLKNVAYRDMICKDVIYETKLRNE